MVGLGLLGTFIGLLETLIATSELIGSIAGSLSGGGGNMESEFGKIVGGLQKPLSAMGTAFSASMFGLVGSIMLGFQGVVVNKTAATLVDNIREEVLSLAEKSQVNANVEITERYLATLLADIMEQHRQSEDSLSGVAQMLAELMPKVSEAALSSTHLASVVSAQHEALDRTAAAVGQVRDVVPLIADLASSSAQNLRESVSTRSDVNVIASYLPDQATMNKDLRSALDAMADLRKQVDDARNATKDLNQEVRLQGAVIKRLDALLWNNEKSSLRKVLEHDPQS
jgi:methyl-accepting chemotaxis protein